MEMSAEEVKQFWRGFCQRRKISADLIAKGEAVIDKDPDYWADQTMGDLLDQLTGKRPVDPAKAFFIGKNAMSLTYVT